MASSENANKNTGYLSALQHPVEYKQIIMKIIVNNFVPKTANQLERDKSNFFDELILITK